MPSVGPVVPVGDSSVGSYTTHTGGTSLLYQEIDEGTASPVDTDFVTAPNDTDSADYSFTLPSWPGTGFNGQRTLTYNLRYRLSGTPPGSSKDTYGIAIRVMNGATVLAAADSSGTFATAVAGTTAMSTTFANTGVTTFAYCNTTASSSTWNSAVVTIRQTYSKTGANDAHAIQVSAIQIDGSYNTVINGSAGSFTETGGSATVRASRKLPSSAGSYTLTGGSATTRHNYPMSAGAGSFALSGGSATVLTARKIAGGSATYSLTGQTASLTYSGAGGTTTITGQGSSTLLFHS